MADMTPNRPEARVIAVQLDETVAVRFLVELKEPNGRARSMHVKVCFPEEARALLETMSWTATGCIRDVVLEIGDAYAGTVLMTNSTNEADGGADGRGRRPPMLLNMPLGFFRAGLECP